MAYNQHDSTKNEEGYSWVVYSCGMGTGIEIDEIAPGQEWYEGVGEEEKGRFSSYEAAREFCQRTYSMR